MTHRRWVCPQCGSGKHAPSRPRRDDARRYCLDCTARTGRLVERVCPALERERAGRKEKSAARTARAREQAVARNMAGDVDLVAEARRFARLPALRDRISNFPSITVRHSKKNVRASGHCRYGNPARIVVTVGSDSDDAVMAMLHEMVHAAIGYEGHSALFWSTLRRAAREAWPQARFDFANARDGWKTDRAIRDGLANYRQDVPVALS